MNNKSIEFLNIKEKDIITVIGAGGKTSLINYISTKFKNDMKILLTTTTKIYVPNKTLYNNMYMLDKLDNIQSNIIDIKKGITVVGRCINKEDKVIGLDFNDLDNLISNFDITLIEGDGSKKKKLKGWNDTEPVVYEKTTKTIGIIDITCYGMDINDENIHRLKEFKNIIKDNYENSKKIDLDILVKIILSNNGLFSKAIKEKVLFINKVENEYYENLTKELIKKIKKEDNSLNIFYGSVKNEIFKRYNQ